MKKLTGVFGWLLIAVIVAVSPSAMAQDWIGWGGHSYALTSESDMLWDAAQAEAEDEGGYLVTINSAAENAWLASTFAVGYHAGGNDKAVEGEWRWAENDQEFWHGAAGGSLVAPYTYENWNGNPNSEPNDSSGEDEMEVGGTGGWNDNQDAEHYGIMEKNEAVLNLTGPGGGVYEEGSYVVLLVNVPDNGSSSFTFTWTHNGAPLAEDSNQLVFDEVAMADAGVYRCVVEDDWTSGEVAGSLQVVAPGTLPVGGMLGLSLLAAACALGGARVLRRK